MCIRDSHCVELNLKLENKEGAKIEASTTNITLSKSELLEDVYKRQLLVIQRSILIS